MGVKNREIIILHSFAYGSRQKYYGTRRDGDGTGRDETKREILPSKHPNQDRFDTFELSIQANRDFSRRDKVGTRRDETAFLVSSRREILDFIFLDPSLRRSSKTAVLANFEALNFVHLVNLSLHKV